jgi:hypothetical protein
MCPGACCRLLRSYDYICLINAIMFCLVLIKAFFANWATYQRVQTLWYLTQAVVQLLFMHFKGDTYQRYRFQVGCLCITLNAAVCWCVLGSAWHRKHIIVQAVSPLSKQRHMHGSAADEHHCIVQQCRTTLREQLQNVSGTGYLCACDGRGPGTSGWQQATTRTSLIYYMVAIAMDATQPDSLAISPLLRHPVLCCVDCCCRSHVSTDCCGSGPYFCHYLTLSMRSPAISTG